MFWFQTNLNYISCTEDNLRFQIVKKEKKKTFIAVHRLILSENFIHWAFDLTFYDPPLMIDRGKKIYNTSPIPFMPVYPFIS